MIGSSSISSLAMHCEVSVLILLFVAWIYLESLLCQYEK